VVKIKSRQYSQAAGRRISSTGEVRKFHPALTNIRYIKAAVRSSRTLKIVSRGQVLPALFLPTLGRLVERSQQRTCGTFLSSRGGPYSAIFDLSAVKETLIPVDVVRGYGRRAPSVPTGKAHVVVGKAPAIFGLARIFQMCGEAVGKEHEVVHTLEEAYKIVGVQPEDFTERL